MWVEGCVSTNEHSFSGAGNQRLRARVSEFSDEVSLNLFVGTWNVAGGKHVRSANLRGSSLADWLIVPLERRPVDIYAIGFEEIVDLTAQNIMATAQTTRQEWADNLSMVLGSDFGLVTSVQLVGVCLFLFVRNEHLHSVKQVVTDSVKTGAGGNLGNKGGVAVRLRIYDTSIVFVCAHLAAGQSRTTERNSDYTEITRRLNFGKGRTLASHDHIIWCD